MEKTESSTATMQADDIVESLEEGMTILRSPHRRLNRRIVFINVPFTEQAWRMYRNGHFPSNHMWGCIELVRLGYEVGVAKPLPDFYLHKDPLPHDLRLLRQCTAWLRADDIIYCAHNTLYWLPLLRRMGVIRRRIVSLLYAREPLDHASGHDGIIALTPAAEQEARRVAPRAKIARLAWGMDLDFIPRLPFSPEWFLACGRTNRDARTLQAASRSTLAKIRLFAHEPDIGDGWPPNVDVLPGGHGWEQRVSYRELLNDHYSGCIASLVILKDDPIEYTACGFTNLLEAMAMSRPVIMTRTNAVPGEIDIEAAGYGIWTLPGDAPAVARAITDLDRNPELARQMGAKGRKLCDSYYNMRRFGLQLHQFFQAI